MIKGRTKLIRKNIVLIILISIVLMCIAITHDKTSKDEVNVEVADSSSGTIESKPTVISKYDSAVITLENKRLLDGILDRVDEVYKSNGLMFINFDEDAKDSCSLVLRETGEAYMEYGKQITLFLNNGKAINLTSPITISKEGIPLEIVKGCASVISRGYGSVERGSNNNDDYTVMKLNDIDSIVKAYDYVSTDYGWGVISGYGIKDSDSVSMSIYVYDKVTNTDDSSNKLESKYLPDSWCEFRCECIFRINGTDYSAWWTTGSQKMESGFYIDTKIYNYDENTSTRKWEESLVGSIESIKKLLSNR